MKIETIGKILLADLTASPGNVLVVPEVEVLHGRPSNDVLAGICLPDADGLGNPRYVSIEFHHGRKAWHLKTEYALQQAIRWDVGNLPDLMRKFESLVGVQLPMIKIIEIGVGVYAANSKYEADNPWRLQDGRFYTVHDPKQGQRTFVADVRNGRALISFVTEGEVSAIFDPSVVLSQHDWRTLSPVDEQPDDSEPQGPSIGI